MAHAAPRLVASVSLLFSQLVAVAPVQAQSRDTAASVPAPAQSKPPGGNWGGSGNSNGGNTNNNWNGGNAGNGSLICESWNYQYRRCTANTGNNVQLTRRIAGDCTQGRNWGFDRHAIWVNHGCRAQFRYGYSGGGGGYPPGGQWGQGYAAQVRCESWNWAYRACRTNTQGRVDLLRTVAGTCQRGRSWGYDNNIIWVNNGCRADFGYGFGRVNGNASSNSNTGEIIAGAALAAGLLALLGSANNSSQSSASTTVKVNDAAPPARIVAAMSVITAAARPSVQTCLDEAARQIGATGGTQVRLDKITAVTKLGTGWSFRAQLVTTYPDQQRIVPLDCRADEAQLLSLDFVG
jgi:hypothetical protein